MQESTPEQFPFDEVRDLLGILRALYASDRARGAGARRLASIRRVAAELTCADAAARSSAPGSAAHAAAWRRAERATLRLGELVDVTTPLHPTLLAAGERIWPKKTVSPLTFREAAKRARAIRS